MVDYAAASGPMTVDCCRKPGPLEATRLSLCIVTLRVVVVLLKLTESSWIVGICNSSVIQFANRASKPFGGIRLALCSCVLRGNLSPAVLLL